MSQAFVPGVYTSVSTVSEVVSHRQQSSTQIDRNTRGYTVTVKVYDDDPSSAVDRAVAELRRAEEQLGLAPLDMEEPS